MPPLSLGNVLRYPLPFLSRLYSVLEGLEQLEEQLEAMFEKRTLNSIDASPKSRSYDIYKYYFLVSFYMI